MEEMKVKSNWLCFICNAYAYGVHMGRALFICKDCLDKAAKLAKQEQTSKQIEGLDG